MAFLFTEFSQYAALFAAAVRFSSVTGAHFVTLMLCSHNLEEKGAQLPRFGQALDNGFKRIGKHTRNQYRKVMTYARDGICCGLLLARAPHIYY